MSTAAAHQPQEATGHDDFAQGGMARMPKGVVLLVFIHGFKGSAQTTFGDFPSRMSHLLSSTLAPSYAVRSDIYPTYDTRGSLALAVEKFTQWLVETVVVLESEKGELKGSGLGRGSVKVILCGHSMGGLVAVDSALSLMRSLPTPDSPLWPRVIGLLAFDTPYYGVHPGVFKNTITKYGGYIQQGREIYSKLAPLAAGAGAGLGGWFGGAAAKRDNSTDSGSSGSRSAARSWSTSLLATGAIAAIAGGAAAGTWAGGGFDYVQDHFLFVRNLWDDKGLRQRLEELMTKPQIFFHAFYNRLPPLTAAEASRAGRPSNQNGQARTFCILPAVDNPSWRCFEAVEDGTASDEIDAHTRMFFTSNPSYFHLGLRCASLISRCVEGEEQSGDQVEVKKEEEDRMKVEEDGDEVRVLHDDQAQEEREREGGGGGEGARPSGAESTRDGPAQKAAAAASAAKVKKEEGSGGMGTEENPWTLD